MTIISTLVVNGREHRLEENGRIPFCESDGGLLNNSLRMANKGHRGDRPRNGRECSKKSVQQGRSPFGARSVLPVREYGKRARTPLAAFFNIPIIEVSDTLPAPDW